jgi:hypothetical protein
VRNRYCSRGETVAFVEAGCGWGAMWDWGIGCSVIMLKIVSTFRSHIVQMMRWSVWSLFPFHFPNFYGEPRTLFEHYANCAITVSHCNCEEIALHCKQNLCFS